MAFRFYIINVTLGPVHGTNDEQIACDYANCENHYVIDAETGQWLTGFGETVVVQEIDS